MNYAYDFLGLHPFPLVSELVRRQKSRYEIPITVARRESRLYEEQFTLHNLGLSFRWIIAVDENGQYLRMLCRQVPATPRC